jgi:hypothetical protein
MPPSEVRAVALVGDSLRGGWIGSELAAMRLRLDVARSVEDAIAALGGDAPPHPQILLVDFDPLSALDVLQLHSIRERGWFGVILAFGNVPDDLRRSLNIERVLPNDTTGAELREAIAKVGLDRPTTRMMPLRARPGGGGRTSSG